MRTTIMLTTLLAIIAAGCGDSGNSTPPRNEAGVDRGVPEVGLGDIGTSACAKCKSDEVCVQSFDGNCATSGAYCLKVDARCRNITAKLGTPSNPCPTPIWDGGTSTGDGSVPMKSCSEQYCSQPYSCSNGSPCGTEDPAAQVYCYGP